MTRHVSLPRVLLASAIAAYLVLAMGVVAIVAGPTRGPIPNEAFPRYGGPIDQALVPLYIPALNREGEAAGWVSRELAVPVVDDGTRQLIPVFADDLRTVVGHMVAGYGFAPSGTDLEQLLTMIPSPPPLEQLSE